MVGLLEVQPKVASIHDYELLQLAGKYDLIYWPLVSWECRNGKEQRNYYNGLSRDYYIDPFFPFPASQRPV